MASQLTGFSKLIITLGILAAVYFGVKTFLDKTDTGKKLKEQAEAKSSSTETGKTTSKSTSSGPRDPNTLKVQLVTWGGYAPGLYFNEGGTANTNSRFYKDYGFKVDFKIENDLLNAMNAWIAGEYDIVVQTADAFPLYTAPKEVNDVGPKAFMQVDWSRGGDAVIVKRNIANANDLKGKKIAVAVPSPAQTLLNSTLEAAGLKYSDVTVVKTTDNFKAAELFRSKEVDAAVVWSPDDVLATRDVPGSRILVTTREQSQLIADIFFAKESLLNEKKDMIKGFYEGWMKGVSEMKVPANYDKAAKYLAEINSVSVEDAKGMMENVYWTNHGDNLNFFGLNTSYKGQRGQDLYEKMSKKFVETGDAPNLAPAWRSAINTAAVQAANTSLTGGGYAAEAPKVFKSDAADRTAAPISIKPISINFESGQFKLSENAKTIIDLQVSEMVKIFGNAKIRVEGNTDNVGSKVTNKTLSLKRAQSVADYLSTSYGLNGKKFVLIGNGPDKPISGCETNASDDCKAKNRRTEFQIIAD